MDWLRRHLFSTAIALMFAFCGVALANMPGSFQPPIKLPVSLTFTQAATDTSSQTIYTTAALSAGQAASNRCLIAVFGSRANTGGYTVSTVTIGGVSATAIATAIDSVAGSDIASIYAANVPTGTTAVVVVTFSNAMLRFGVGLYRLSNSANCTTASDAKTSTTVSTNATTVTLNVPVGGGAVAGNFESTSGAVGASWSGLTEDYDSDVNGNTQSGASLVVPNGNAALVATVTGNATVSRQPLAGASWRP